MNPGLMRQSEARPGHRRLVGLERRYRCHSCGGEHRSWSRLRTCPDCGQALKSAVIRRAAFADSALA
jgi:hypothetical protein